MKVQETLPEFPRREVDVVAISFSSPERIDWLESEFGLSFPILHDPDRKWFGLLGAERGSWLTVFRPSILRRYVTLIRRGYRLRRSREDLRQLGGDVLLSRNRVIRSWVSNQSEQRPGIEEIFREVAL